jgi:hypothetical protein
MLDLLDPEILASIIEYVDDTSPRTTKCIALTNKYLNSVTKLILRRHPTFHLTGIESLQKLSENTFEPWSRDGALLGNIRSITVGSNGKGFSPNDGQYHPDLSWKSFANLISKIGKLRCLIWNFHEVIPISVLQALETHQKQATLQMFNYSPPQETEPTDITRALSRSSALTHLRAVIKREFHVPDTRELHFRKIVAEAPNLRYAGIVNWTADIMKGDPYVPQLKP